MINRGDIYWVLLEGKGSVQRGIRPCIIVQNNIGNAFSNTTIVVPLTSKKPKKLLPTHLEVPGKWLGEAFDDSIALFEQMTTVDKKEQVYGFISKIPELEEINKKASISLGFQIPVY